MSGRTLVLFLVAILIAGVTVVIIKNRAQPGGTSGVKVLVATGDIEAGSFVRADKQLGWVDWPQGDLSPSFVTSDQHKIEEYNGGVARRSILSGEPLTTLSVVRANEGGFMAAVLSPGKRAVSIAVNPTSGNAGFVFPGDHVDLILTHRIPVQNNSGGDVLASETFIQDVRVLAIDQMLDNPNNKAVIAKTITLEVAPKQAEMINVATSLGTISVSLRSLATSIKGAAQASPADAAKPQAEGMPAVPAVPAAAADTTVLVSPDMGRIPYSTNNDVSRLMGDKSDVHSRVSVYHGSTAEQLDFRQGQK